METSFRPLFVFKKSFNEGKAIDRRLSFDMLRPSSIWHTIKTNSIKRQTINPEIF